MLRKLKDYKVKQKDISLQELACNIKGDANSLLWDYSIPFNEFEFKLLFNLVHYMDTFLLKCINKEGKLCNKKWIQKKLITVVIYLGASKHTVLHRLMRKVIDLENLIYLEEVATNGNENSDS